MKNKDVVLFSRGGVRRYGVVTSTKLMEHGWLYAEVDWVDEDATLPKLVRNDHLEIIDLARERDTLWKIYRRL